MALPRLIADVVARRLQKASGSPEPDEEIAFRDITARTDEVMVPTRHGQVRVVRYLPPGGPTGKGVYVNFHGGGFVVRHPEQDDALCRFVAARADVTVLNVDYTPSPQSRFPGAVEEAYDVVVWAAEPGRPWETTLLAVGGQSAGGALAAAVARLALETSVPQVALQVLMYPVLDLTVPIARKASPGKEKLLVRMGPVFSTAYCPDARRRSDRLASPAGASDTAPLAGIAPALVVTAEKDVLREEGARYAERLRGADALVAHVDLPGVGHGFTVLGAPRDVVLPVYEQVVESVRRAFRT